MVFLEKPSRYTFSQLIEPFFVEKQISIEFN